MVENFKPEYHDNQDVIELKGEPIELIKNKSKK